VGIIDRGERPIKCNVPIALWTLFELEAFESKALPTLERTIPESSDILIGKDDLFGFAVQIFRSLRVSEAHARLWAEVLVWADLRGVSSHGVMRIPAYANYIRLGEYNPVPNMRTQRLGGAAIILDADLAPGPVAMMAAMDEAIAAARRVQVGWCVARNITHPGAIGYFAAAAAKAGLAGMAMCASQPMMAYQGTRVAAVSTNPIAIAMPGGEHAPLMLDMSTAEVAMGKVMNARAAGRPIPAHWGLDAEGHETTDPAKVAVLQPMSGAKGSGLSLMIECLTSLFVTNPLIEPVLRTGRPLQGRPMNGLTVAIDPAAFGDAEAFRANVDALIESIAGLPRADGVERIFLPGERGDSILAEREARGIPLPPKVVQDLNKLGGELSIAPLLA
jgi:ureidoglycolate dehydrogenase (NAD+)